LFLGSGGGSEEGKLVVKWGEFEDNTNWKKKSNYGRTKL
jgi:hypothetical protein